MNRTQSLFVTVCVLVLAVFAAGCFPTARPTTAPTAEVPTPPAAPTAEPTLNPLSGGILATFRVVDEEYKVWVTNPQTIQQILDLRDGKSEDTIPNGVILRGAGEGDSNAPYSWHIDPEQIEMAAFTIEVCDAEPSYVEANIDEFVDVVGRYCPWSAELVSVVDYR
jgi:hypothetical protein